VASEHSPEASPDGRWLAYVSDATGREEVFVQDLDGSGSPYKVSSDGGNDPRWRADGRELFYVSAGGRFHAVPTTLGGTFTAGSPKFLFSVPIDEFSNRQYDVTPDGRRFVVTLRKTTVDSPIVVVIGIAGEVERFLAKGGGVP
jgi:dipeptidyl aminopeptidase/acylaminoacyl peptidase